MRKAIRIAFLYLIIYAVSLILGCIDLARGEDKTYRHGRFQVIVSDFHHTQKVIGGKFTPRDHTLLYPIGVSHLITVDYSSKELVLYGRAGVMNGEPAYKPVIGFAVVTPSSDFLPRDIVSGKVIGIVQKPTWCPVQGGAIRRDNPTLPSCIPYGDPRNPMGNVRFDIAWNYDGWDAVKFHDTEEYPRGAFWDTSTYGCVSILTTGMQELLRHLGSNALKEGTLILAIRDATKL